MVEYSIYSKSFIYQCEKNHITIALIKHTRKNLMYRYFREFLLTRSEEKIS